jgi:uncharacterized zinc-type alcohol dehydrogenase-like protein
MTQTEVIQTPGPGEPFERGVIERRELRPDDVAIDIAFAGICHSDIHQARDEWFPGTYPMVPGHEITGTVSAVGAEVEKYSVGDRVGVGCFVDSCGECEYCLRGDEQYCKRGPVVTYNGRDYDGEVTYGGYSRAIVVRRASSSAFPTRSASTSRRRCCARGSRPIRPCATGTSVRARRWRWSAWAGSGTSLFSSPRRWAPR